MKLKLATADFSFPLLPHDNVLDLIAMLDLDGIDIGLFEGRSHLWPSKELKNAAKSGKAMRKKLKDRGLKAADVFLQTNPDFVPYAANHPEAARRKKARDWFEKTLEYAVACDSHHVTALPGVLFPDEPAEASWGRCAEEMAWRIGRAEKAGLTFSVEAHVGSIAPTPRDVMKLLKRVPGLTLTLDYTHFTRAGMKDAQIEPLISHASHFHVRGAAKGRLQTSFKANVIDYKRIVQQMKKVGYKGYLGIEYVWLDWEHCNEVDNLSETILYRDFFRKLA
jgi:sugar phosphate isomerase/epimerase